MQSISARTPRIYLQSKVIEERQATARTLEKIVETNLINVVDLVSTARWSVHYRPAEQREARGLQPAIADPSHADIRIDATRFTLVVLSRRLIGFHENARRRRGRGWLWLDCPGDRQQITARAGEASEVVLEEASRTLCVRGLIDAIAELNMIAFRSRTRLRFRWRRLAGGEMPAPNDDRC